MKSKSFFIATVVLIIGTITLLLVQNQKLKNRIKYSDKIVEISKNNGFTKMDASHLKKIIDKYLAIELRESDINWKLVIFYSPEDCPQCLEEVTFWQQFEKKQKSLKCWGLVNHPYKELVANFMRMKNWDMSYHIIEENEYFGDSFQSKKTPLKVLLNKENQIYFVEGPLPTWDEEGKLIRLMDELI